jgi:hypothetical protein
MMEPLRRSDRTEPPADDDDRATRIEELLVSGLDHYFAADYEQAINIWTRVVFLERDHDRARAYIERARTAIAERQRESEELLHRGVDAYKSGDVERARDLLTQAVDQGAPSDEALVLLNRLERFAGAGFDAAPACPSPSAVRPVIAVTQTTKRHHSRWAIAGGALLIVVAAAVFGAAPLLSWLVEVPAAVPQGVQPIEPLPIVRSADVLLDKARGMYAGGHPHDALRLLDRIDIADPARGDADRLRVEIQRDLLVRASVGAVAAAPGVAR